MIIQEFTKISTCCCLRQHFGTGVMKSLTVVADKEISQNWDEEASPPMFKQLHRPCIYLNFYPDPDAATMEEAEYVVERHKITFSSTCFKKPSILP